MQDIEIDYKDLVLTHCKEYEGEGRLNGFSVSGTPRGYRLFLRDGFFGYSTEVFFQTDSAVYWEAMARMLGIDKPRWLHEHVSAGVSREISRQRAAGKQFLSEEEIAAIVDRVMDDYMATETK